MKSLSEFEQDEFNKTIATLDLSSDDNNKEQFFFTWNFGQADGDYTIINNTTSSDSFCNKNGVPHSSKERHSGN